MTNKNLANLSPKNSYLHTCNLYDLTPATCTTSVWSVLNTRRLPAAKSMSHVRFVHILVQHVQIALVRLPPVLPVLTSMWHVLLLPCLHGFTPVTCVSSCYRLSAQKICIASLLDSLHFISWIWISSCCCTISFSLSLDTGMKDLHYPVTETPFSLVFIVSFSFT